MINVCMALQHPKEALTFYFGWHGRNTKHALYSRTRHEPFDGAEKRVCGKDFSFLPVLIYKMRLLIIPPAALMSSFLTSKKRPHAPRENPLEKAPQIRKPK